MRSFAGRLSRRHSFNRVLRLLTTLCLLKLPTISAHNAAVYQWMVDFAYQEMLLIQSAVEAPPTGRILGVAHYSDSRDIFAPPPDVNEQEWSEFLLRIAGATRKYKARSSD